jgi:hypothetical protein
LNWVSVPVHFQAVARLRRERAGAELEHVRAAGGILQVEVHVAGLEQQLRRGHGALNGDGLAVEQRQAVRVVDVQLAHRRDGGERARGVDERNQQSKQTAGGSAHRGPHGG